MNLPALFIILLLSLVLIRGVKGSSLLNTIIVIIKVGIVLMFIGFGWSYINAENYVPYIPQYYRYCLVNVGVYFRLMLTVKQWTTIRIH